MAVDFMTMTEADKKFFDDNMLSEHDLELDMLVDLNLSFEEDSFLKNIGSQLPTNFDLEVGFINNEEGFCSTSNASTPDKLEREATEDSSFPEIKLEPYSPTSSRETSCSSPNGIFDPDMFIPEITILDGDVEMKFEVETPPDTPPEVFMQHSPPPEKSIFVSSAPVINVPVVTTINSIVHNVSTTSSLKIKPIIPVQNNRLTSHNSSPPLVLTQEQFAKLTSEGLFKIKPQVSPAPDIIKHTVLLPSPVDNKKSVVQKIPIPASTNKTTLHNGTFPVNNSSDVKALKRQQRMIKNRESAFQSRKKKKEYLVKLELEVMNLMEENGKLKSENSHLRNRISELEKESENLKRKTILPKDVKKTTCLMAILFMITINLAPFSFFAENAIPNKPHISEQRTGRSLLWKTSESSDQRDHILSSNFLNSMVLENQDIQREYHVNIDGKNISEELFMCPMYINKTESLRLVNELQGWVLRVEKEKLKLEETSRKLKTKNKPLIPKIPAWINKVANHQKPKYNSPKYLNELQIYETPRKVYEDFFAAIHRRNDTFYFVSFSGDHLLLPATAHNKTQRPRMSLVMPAMTFNESMQHSEEQVTMMQIDCEVMNTKLVYVKESLIPSHLWHRENHTTAGEPTYSGQYPSRHDPITSKFHKTKLHKKVSQSRSP